MLSKPAF
jgi:hypothetical protein